MKTDNKKIGFILFLLISFTLSACSFFKSDINLTDVKMCYDVDDKLMPINITQNFSEGTSKIFCWFKWQKTKINTEVLTSWHYLSDDIHIYDYTFKIPRKEGTGSVSLAMPQGKIFPPGSYRVDLISKNHILKSLTFKVAGT